MDQEQLLKKLYQIEEQARLTLEEFPRHLTKERLRLVIGLARQMRTELTAAQFPAAAFQDSADEATLPGGQAQNGGAR